MVLIGVGLSVCSTNSKGECLEKTNFHVILFAILFGDASKITLFFVTLFYFIINYIIALHLKCIENA